MSDTTETPAAPETDAAYEPVTPDEVPVEPTQAGEESYVLESPNYTADPNAPKAYVWGTGRRKSSVARVRIAPGSGNVRVKRAGGAYRELNDYFQNERDRKTIFGPLEATQYGGKLDIFVNAHGGGSTGQAGAIVMGLARALMKYDPQAEPALREAGFMTRDSRMKERKKYGQRGARRRFQFSKR